LEVLTIEDRFAKYYRPAEVKEAYVNDKGMLVLQETPVIKKLLTTDEKIIILQGGGDSGKTTGTLTAICVWLSLIHI
jgi:hypothetical protein